MLQRSKPCSGAVEPSHETVTSASHAFLQRGSSSFKRANISLFLAGLSTFALLYDMQPLLPILAQTFGLDAGASSLSVSVATGALALALLFASWLSDAWSRKAIMAAALIVSSALCLAVALCPWWQGILVARALTGLALSGVPAVALAYLGEEVAPRDQGYAVGLYIAGNAIGGMSGRLLVGILAEWIGWRWSLGVLGVLALGSSLAFVLLLPPSRHFVRQRVPARVLLQRMGAHLRNPAQCMLYAEAFLLMGSFVTLYNYIGFRLSAAPYGLSHAAIASIFAVYLVGSAASAWIGALSATYGQARLLWPTVLLMGLGVALMALAPLPAVIAGIAVTTFGFFAAHALASGWVGRLAATGRAQASALYLCGYYLGSSLLGTLGGSFWERAGWGGVSAMVGVALAAALAIALRLAWKPPQPEGATGSALPAAALAETAESP